MKAKDIKIDGFTSDLSPDDKPCITVHGLDNSGKTRLAISAPDPIGVLALDKNSKRTVEKEAELLNKVVIVNSTPFLSDKEAIKLALVEDPNEVKKAYTEVYKRTLDSGMRLADHNDIRTVVIDTGSQLFDYVLFAHFGRRTQIPPTSRAAANQDMIDFMNALRSKNVVIIHRSKEIWKSTGATDKQGNPIKEPSGKFELEGFKNVGYFCTAAFELINKKTAKTLEEKFRVKVITCKTNSMLEGQDLHEYGVSGADISWDNIMTAIGVTE